VTLYLLSEQHNVEIRLDLQLIRRITVAITTLS